MLERILVPLDGSDNAEMALPYAEELVLKARANLDLVGICETPPENLRQLFCSYLGSIREKTQNDISWLDGAAEIKLSDKVLTGDPALEILRYARESQPDLIVMSSKGASVQGPWPLGNVAAKVLRASSIPVLLVRSPAKELPLPEKHLIKRILVPLDCSAMGASALPFIEILAGVCQADLVLLYVIQPPDSLLMFGQGLAGVPTPVMENLQKIQAEEYLETISMRLNRMGLKTSTAINFGLPAEKIGDFAKENEIDLIAMSSHGRTGLGRWVFGSVTDKVLHAGDSTVLVVRAEKV
jgi:nucleotide-binding universal stress UspA family protein